MRAPWVGELSPAKSNWSRAITSTSWPSACSCLQSLPSKCQPRAEQQKPAVHRGVQADARTVTPGDQRLVECDQLPRVVPFKVRNQKINRVSHGAQRLPLLQRHLVEVAAQDQDAEDHHEANRGI